VPQSRWVRLGREHRDGPARTGRPALHRGDLHEPRIPPLGCASRAAEDVPPGSDTSGVCYSQRFAELGRAIDDLFRRREPLLSRWPGVLRRGVPVVQASGWSSSVMTHESAFSWAGTPIGPSGRDLHDPGPRWRSPGCRGHRDCRRALRCVSSSSRGCRRSRQPGHQSCRVLPAQSVVGYGARQGTAQLIELVVGVVVVNRRPDDSVQPSWCEVPSGVVGDGDGYVDSLGVKLIADGVWVVALDGEGDDAAAALTLVVHERAWLGEKSAAEILRQPGDTMLDGIQAEVDGGAGGDAEADPSGVVGLPVLEAAALRPCALVPIHQSVALALDPPSHPAPRDKEELLGAIGILASPLRAAG
jgi:hypothetical protein